MSYDGLVSSSQPACAFGAGRDISGGTGHRRYFRTGFAALSTVILIAGPFGATTVPRWNFSSSPLIDGDRVACLPGGPKGTMIALNKESGAVLWQTATVTDNASYSSVIVGQIDANKTIANQLGGAILVGDYVYVSIDSGGLLTCLDFKTGKILWQDKSVGKASLDGIRRRPSDRAQ